MKHFFLKLLFMTLSFYVSAVLALDAAQSSVILGSERVLQPDYIHLLKGKRIALVANYSSVNSKGEPDIEIFAKNPDIHLVAIFTPEHGLHVNHASDIKSRFDKKLKVPIYSLYGPRRSRTPMASELDKIDVIVFDLQSVGLRYYTYATTLALTMQAAKKFHKRIIVLDRVNPLGGAVVAAPILAEKYIGQFTGYYPIPTCYGLTMGELAKFYNKFFRINADLTVVPLANWKRNMRFNETGLKWVSPSPALPTFQQAFLYSIFGPLEATRLSVGYSDSYRYAYHYYGAPWISKRTSTELVKRLRVLALPGLQFDSIAWRQTHAPYKGKICRGFAVKVTDYTRVKTYPSMLSVLSVLYQTLGDQLKLKWATVMIGQRWVVDAIQQGEPVESIIAKTDQENKRFMQQRQQILMYQ